MKSSTLQGIQKSSLNEQAVRLRKDFPLLQRTVHDGKPLVYLDSAATSQKPLQVIDAVVEYYRHHNSNVHRALHTVAEQATAAYEGARNTVAGFIGAGSPNEVVFTRGTTDAINLVAAGWGRKFIQAGDEILVTEMEHHSNLIPWQQLARERGAVLRHVPVREDGHLDQEAFEKLLNPKVALLAIVHMSNLLGTVNPVQQMIAQARRCGACVLVDGAQSVPHLPVDVQALDCDFLAFSGHKMLGPTGIGVLYGKSHRLEEMEPAQFGGEMIRKVSWDAATWAEVPHKFEAGTPNIAGAIGLGAAVEYLQAVGMEAVHQHEVELTAYALDKLTSLKGLTLRGPRDRRGGAISFEVAGLHPHDLAQFVDQDGVAIRAGHMCVQPLVKKYGVAAVSRASLYLYNTTDDIDQLVRSVQRAREFFDHGTG